MSSSSSSSSSSSQTSNNVKNERTVIPVELRKDDVGEHMYELNQIVRPFNEFAALGHGNPLREPGTVDKLSSLGVAVRDIVNDTRLNCVPYTADGKTHLEAHKVPRNVDKLKADLNHPMRQNTDASTFDYIGIGNPKPDEKRVHFLDTIRETREYISSKQYTIGGQITANRIQQEIKQDKYNSLFGDNKTTRDQFADSFVKFHASDQEAMLKKLDVWEANHIQPTTNCQSRLDKTMKEAKQWRDGVADIKIGAKLIEASHTEHHPNVAMADNDLYGFPSGMMKVVAKEQQSKDQAIRFLENTMGTMEPHPFEIVRSAALGSFSISLGTKEDILKANTLQNILSCLDQDLGFKSHFNSTVFESFINKISNGTKPSILPTTTIDDIKSENQNYQQQHTEADLAELSNIQESLNDLAKKQELVIVDLFNEA